MAQLIAIIVSVSSFIYSFINKNWCWAPLTINALLLLVVLFSVKQQKWRYVDELSPMANVMLQKYGHFYSKPAAGSDFSAACSTIMFGALAVFTVCAFNGFY